MAWWPFTVISELVFRPIMLILTERMKWIVHPQSPYFYLKKFNWMYKLNSSIEHTLEFNQSMWTMNHNAYPSADTMSPRRYFEVVFSTLRRRRFSTKLRRRCDIADWSKITNKFRPICDIVTTSQIGRNLRVNFDESVTSQRHRRFFQYEEWISTNLRRCSDVETTSQIGRKLRINLDKSATLLWSCRLVKTYE